MSQTPEQIFALSASPEEAPIQWQTFLGAYHSVVKRPFKPTEKRNRLLLPLFGNSSFLGRYVVHHPFVVRGVLDSRYLLQPKPYRRFLAEAKQSKNLRQFKYRELLRITLKDLHSTGANKVVLAELSSLALAILQVTNEKVYKETAAQWGSPLVAKSSRTCGYQIVAMGKLAGLELNYSSDIDLLAVTETDNASTKKGLSAHEFFIRFAQQLTTFLQSATSDGFLYRVDWDLRPEGRAGTLVNSLSALESYYETFGADWERQALIRSLPVVGSPLVGKKFAQFITPFVYRKHLDLKAIEGVGRMKERIQSEAAARHEEGYNVKLGSGGIREAEFFVQSFLLLFGGIHPSLRQPNTLKALEALSHLKILSMPEARQLGNDYLFLRRVEHRLQMEDEQQTHLLLANDTAQLKVARRMGYGHPDDGKALLQFRKELSAVTLRIQRHFDSLFSKREIKRRVPAPSLRLEEALEEIRLFKSDAEREIVVLEERRGVSRREILERLSDLAILICNGALSLAIRELEALYGSPQAVIPSGLFHPSELALVGMGKFGGREINYRSDLDMIFIYSHPGETNGPRRIANSEYFARLVQKFIFILSVTTRNGRAYQIDTELRPSGKAGTLVTSLESFMEYQREVSQVWERQALLRARPIVGPPHLCGLVEAHLKALLFSSPSPTSIAAEMKRLRKRVEAELARENRDFFDYKLGKGGIMDIEFVLQYLQLRKGSEIPSLTTANTFDGLDVVIEQNLLGQPDDAVLLKEAYAFYRTIESKLSLASGRSLSRLSISDELVVKTAAAMDLSGPQQLLKDYFSLRDEVRRVYDRVFKASHLPPEADPPLAEALPMASEGLGAIRGPAKNSK